MVAYSSALLAWLCLALQCQCTAACKLKLFGVPSPSQIDPFERELVLLLQKERQRQGISANQLAAKIGISRTTITHIESDLARPTLWVMFKIAHGLGHSLTQFVREAEKRGRKQ